MSDNNAPIFEQVALDNASTQNLTTETASHNGSTSPSLSPLQIFSVVIFTVTCSISLMAYILVLYIIFVYFKEFKSNFYCIIASLAVADIGFVVLVLLYLVPCTVTQSDIWPSVPYAPGLIESISYFAGCTHLTYIGFNRLVYSCVTGSNNPVLDKIFTSRGAVAVWIVVCWVGGVTTPIMVKLAGCQTTYDYVHMAFEFTCQEVTAFTDVALLCDNVVGGVLPCLITVTQVSAWVMIYWKRRRTGSGDSTSEIEKQQRKRERRLLIQFTLISAALIFYYASFWAIPAWSNNSYNLVLITYSGIASVAVNPFTYLAFNKLMKAKAKYLICQVCFRRKKAGGTVGPSQRDTTTQIPKQTTVQVVSRERSAI